MRGKLQGASIVCAPKLKTVAAALQPWHGVKIETVPPLTTRPSKKPLILRTGELQAPVFAIDSAFKTLTGAATGMGRSRGRRDDFVGGNEDLQAQAFEEVTAEFATAGVVAQDLEDNREDLMGDGNNGPRLWGAILPDAQKLADVGGLRYTAKCVLRRAQPNL